MLVVAGGGAESFQAQLLVVFALTQWSACTLRDSRTIRVYLGRPEGVALPGAKSLGAG